MKTSRNTNRVSMIGGEVLPSPDGGSYNDWPKHAKKLSKERAQLAINEMLFTYSPESTEFRQAKKDNKFHTLRIFWRHDGTGLMAVNVSEFVGREYVNRIDWYHIGCQHKYVELSMEECRKLNIMHMGRCYHVEKCKKCGHVNSYDSSD